jgi:hypothetical protein
MLFLDISGYISRILVSSVFRFTSMIVSLGWCGCVMG